VVKQADVLMLHLLVPEETEASSLAPNLAFYGPRTVHGSSLSPAVHAALLARVGEPDRALELDPCRPAAWETVELRLRYHGRRLHLRAGHDRLDLVTDGPVPVRLSGLPARTVVPPGATWRRAGTAWEEDPR
jgi:trehalose/maltose hydrolase-like predicted phosphorylase